MSAETLSVAVVQTRNRVGDLAGNARQIREAMRWAETADVDVLLLPEMSLTGYPIQDLAFREHFVNDVRAALLELAQHSGRVATLVGCTDRVATQRSWDTRERTVAIGQAVLCDGEVRGVYHKVLLPTYDVFDEARTFAAGRHPSSLWRIGEAVVGISICEDVWSGDGPPEAQAAAGAQMLLVPNGSPFYRDKENTRRDLVASVAQRCGVPIVYANCVGGHDDLVFDGDSFAMDADGRELCSALQFEEDRFVVDIPLAPPRADSQWARTVHTRRRHERPRIEPTGRAPALDGLEQVWSALRMGLRDFAAGSGFEGVAVALSGGVDSSVCLLLAAEAVGAANVLALAMPAGEHEHDELEDARALCRRLEVELIEWELMDVLRVDAAELGAGEATELARLGVEARGRAMLLVSVAGARGMLPLATVNKTELAVGAAALFGESAGGFAPLRDCPKTLVYELAHWHQSRHGHIPARTLERIATLRERAGADLPPFDVLDAIVERYINGEDEVDALVADGFDEQIVRGVLQLIDDAEYKRRLAPMGVKITERAFGQDLRMPVANRWRPYQVEEEALVADPEGVEMWEAGEALAG